jgi:hypothetical protein
MLLVAPAITAFVWWLLARGADVDAWSLDRPVDDDSVP